MNSDIFSNDSGEIYSKTDIRCSKNIIMISYHTNVEITLVFSKGSRKWNFKYLSMVRWNYSVSSKCLISLIKKISNFSLQPKTSQDGLRALEHQKTRQSKESDISWIISCKREFSGKTWPFSTKIRAIF